MAQSNNNSSSSSSSIVTDDEDNGNGTNNSPSTPSPLITPPPDHGFFLTLLQKNAYSGGSNSSGSSPFFVEISYVPDEPFYEIHPHAYCHSVLTDVRRLRGGGSGVAVFAGHHPMLGDVVMKHGGYKDTAESFALVTVQRELHLRSMGRRIGGEGEGGEGTTGGDDDAAEGVPEAVDAAEWMQNRIPEFRFIYISPKHLRDRGLELWSTLRRAVQAWGSQDVLLEEGDDNNDGSDGSNVVDDVNQLQSPKEEFGKNFYQAAKKRSSQVSMRKGRCVNLYDCFEPGGTDGAVKTGKVRKQSLDMYLGPCAKLCTTTADGTNRPCIHMATIGRNTEEEGSYAGYDELKKPIDVLKAIQKEHFWKFTLAQKTIGGSNPETASSILTQGRLSGRLLQTLLDEMVGVIHKLQILTLDDERDAVEEVRIELENIESMEEIVEASQVTHLADSFVGFAIKKNFHPRKGRFKRLRDMGSAFRESFMEEKGRNEEGASGEMKKKLMLTDAEVVPAYHLGMLLRRGACMDETFVLDDDTPPSTTATGSNNNSNTIDTNTTTTTTTLNRTALDMCDNKSWISLLHHAIITIQNPTALSRVWTCGLTDAGLHNLFLSVERLWLFDLGEPNLQPVPSFLTKFLMSFFHALGMEEIGDEGDWVRRFDVVIAANDEEEVDDGDDDNGSGGKDKAKKTKLTLTTDTINLLPSVSDAFRTSLNHLLKTLFDNDDAVRRLLLKYVILQLLSDAAFCLERWEIKGGGSESVGNHHKSLEKWLWRALWDLYVAWYVKRQVDLGRF